MKQLVTFTKKEIAHILRDKKSLLILLVLPIVQILIFGFVLSNEVKNAKILIVDQARNTLSSQIISKIGASQYFEMEKATLDPKQIDAVFKASQADLAILFPINFDFDRSPSIDSNIQIIADASNPNYATTTVNYVSAIIQELLREENADRNRSYSVQPELRMLYNPQLKGAPNFVPGVMALVLMLVCVMMTAVSIVREKENGTMEVLLVSPMKPLFVIIAKTVPYLIMSCINVITILLVSTLVLEVPIKGNIVLLLLESILFILTCLALGVFISIKTKSQQAAMLISLMGLLLPTVIFSGFMFPIENMPEPLQWFSNIIPAKWYYLIVKAVMIKGLGFMDIWKESLILFGTMMALLVVSLRSFKTRLE